MRSAKEVEARAYHHGRERAAAVGVVGEQGVNGARPADGHQVVAGSPRGKAQGDGHETGGALPGGVGAHRRVGEVAAAGLQVHAYGA